MPKQELLTEWYDPKHPTDAQKKEIEQEKLAFEKKIKARMSCPKCMEIRKTYKSNSNWITGCFDCAMKEDLK